MNRLTKEGNKMVALTQQLHRPTGCHESRAVFSPDRRWRYRLVRVWDSDKPRLGWVILNGSDADEHRTDATVRRCIGFARAWGYGGVDIANLYGLVSKNPGALAHHFDPVGPDNDAHLAAMCSENDLTMLAWDPTPAPSAPTRCSRCCVSSPSSVAGRWPCWVGPTVHTHCIPCWRPRTPPPNA
jgi:hypothetical protein